MESRIGGIAAALRSRDIPLGKPVTDDVMQDFDTAFGSRVGLDVRSVYREFDGFEEYDHRSQLLLWPIDEIRKFREKNGEIGNRKGWWCIGDFLIDSDYIAVRIEAEISEVMLLYEERILGETMQAFLGALSEGKFDFLP